MSDYNHRLSLYSGTDQASDMNLLAYFMAHAPAEPQSWFEPSLDESAPTPYVDANGFPQAERYTSEAATIPNKANPAHVDWIKKRDRARYIQWPRAWALAQIEQLNRS